jgi:hypothetical protein
MAASRTAERPTGRVRARGRASPTTWLLIVGLGFLAAQLLLVGPDRAPSWDEAIYLSQVTPDAEAMNMVASRARGVTYLVAAPLALGASLETVRVLLSVASAVGLVGAFVPWVGVVGAAAPVAAALFGSGWVALFYGSEVMPNLWVALAGLGAIGFVARGTARSGTRRDVVVAAGLLALAALVRPFDAAVLGGVAIALALLARRDVAWSAGVPAAGLVLGTLPWAAENAARYGGLAAAFDRATADGRLAPTDPVDSLVQYLATLDGPTIGPVTEPAIPAATIVTLVAAIGLGAVGLIRSRGRPEGLAMAATALGATVSAALYVVLVQGIAPRFLTPALAMASIPVAVGVVELWRRRSAGLCGLIVLAALAWLGWQSSVAASIGSATATERAASERIGLAIRRETPDDGACAVVSEVAYPQIGYPSGCRGRGFPRSGSAAEAIAQERARGTATLFVVTRGRPPQPLGLADATAVDGPGGRLFLSRVGIGP